LAARKDSFASATGDLVIVLVVFIRHISTHLFEAI
jgi:hypothetical protein